MKRTRIAFLLISCLCISLCSAAQARITDPYLLLHAESDDPLYTTYTASMDRARLYSDKGYKLDHYTGCLPHHYHSDHSGDMFCLWKINDVVVKNLNEYCQKPVITASFPDMAILEYEPWEGIHVQETFLVYNSGIALVDMFIENKSNIPHTIALYPVILFDKDSLDIRSYNETNGTYFLRHRETHKRLISDLYGGGRYPRYWQDILTTNVSPRSHGGYIGNMDDFYTIIKTDFYSDDRRDSLNLLDEGFVRFVSLHAGFELSPGGQKNIRYIRGMQDEEMDEDAFLKEIEVVKHIRVQPFIDQNIRLFSSIPRISFQDKDDKLVYLSAFNLARGCMLPPAGKTKHNFYVFSREPLWGWGHGHQVLHESLSMLAYAYLDPISAQGSQRVYMEQQRADGLIAYRHGPRGAQTYPHKGMATTSAPFYSWINREIYSVSKDKDFLEDAYASGKKYATWLEKNRDRDQDGLYEWGPYGIIENVRDWYNAVFQVSAERYLDVDKEDISDELECLDLSLMVVNEMRSLSFMAGELGKIEEATRWEKKADALSIRINEVMWDDSSGFFYHVDKNDHSFRFMTRNLKRQEIIGFLPLWAKAVDPGRADTLVATLTNTDKFWRKYGVPTLSAKDPWYSPYVDYCCKWNGPVWLLWDYMVFRGLINYGYDDLALELSNKMLLAVKTQLSKNHNFWESYSPDNDVLNCPSNYIWDTIMARLLIDREKIANKPTQ